ncbi:MAG: glutamate--tRNA ligase [Actinobacteria bacterium]|nr:glutamate--tRNA ligase [Actinomycetota bacterium]
MTVRVRFAPSPTGYLHLGGARTALYNWLFAKANKGKFVLRIEDTDRTRSTDEAIGSIIKSLSRLGLNWDEGPDVDGDFGPYRQTERLNLYKEAAEKLLNEGKAYFCYCLPEELEKRRKEALKEGASPKYNGRCRNLAEEERGLLEKEGRKPVIRFKVVQDGSIRVNDIIRGEINFENKFLDDLIIVRTDGTPTYNFAAVIDDAMMKITHIIRGDDHLSNTPRQILIYEALGYPLPVFAHLPLIFGSDKTPLSKRHADVAIDEYFKKGYLPEVLINYLALLGWSYDEKTTIFSLNELIEKFSLGKVTKSPAIFDLAKLEWMNGYYIRQLDVDELTDMVLPFLEEAGFKIDIPRGNLKKIIALIQERIKCLKEVVGLTDFFFKDLIEFDQGAVEKMFKKSEAMSILETAEKKLLSLSDFNVNEIELVLRKIPEELNLKPKQVFQTIRVAVAGKLISPPLFETIELLGQEKSAERIKRAKEMIN